MIQLDKEQLVYKLQGTRDCNCKVCIIEIGNLNLNTPLGFPSRVG